MSYVDFHLHLFSRPYFEALAAQSPQSGTSDEKLARATATARIELPSSDLHAHVARWLAEFDRHGVERACAFASAPEEIPAVAEAAQIARGRLVPIALVNPRVEGSAERVRTLMQTKDFRGVLLFPALHHYHLAGAECAPLLEVLDELGGIAFVQCGMLVVKLRDLLGLPRTADLQYASPLGLIPAANARRNVRFVVPHFGAGFLREALIAGAQCPNVYVDSSSSNGWIATQPERLTLRDVFERALAVFGAERVLFGTDSCTFPAGWRHERLAEQRGVLQELGLDAERIELVLGGNARRLLDQRGASPGPSKPSAKVTPTPSKTAPSSP